MSGEMAFFSRRARNPLTALEAIVRTYVRTVDDRCRCRCSCYCSQVEKGLENEVEGLENEVEEDKDNGHEKDNTDEYSTGDSDINVGVDVD